MQEFPNLVNGSVALMRADTLTGHVLDNEFQLAINDSQIVFTLFEDVEDALKSVKVIMASHSEIECVIYGQDRTVLHYISPYDKSR